MLSSMRILIPAFLAFFSAAAVLGASPPGQCAVNLALKRSASASEKSTWPETNAVDGLYVSGKPLCGFFDLPTKGSWLSGNSPQFPKWWGVDLGEPQTISRVVVHANPAYQPTEAWIEASVDGVGYFKATAPHKFARYEPAFGFCFTPVKARHFRVCLGGSYAAPGGNQVGLSEVEVYADHDPITLEVFEPFHGAVLNPNYDEQPATKDIDVYVRGYAQGAKHLKVNGEAVPLNPDFSFAKLITLAREKETIEVTASNGTIEKSEKRMVLVDKYSYKRYWFNVDDVLHMVYDLHVNRDKYRTIFDQPEFAFLRSLHEKYGTCCALMLFWEATKGDKDLRADFTLAQVPDKFREEFRANSGWLKFSFHSKNSRAYPYKTADYRTAYNDFAATKKEIDRFAGPECFSPIAVFHYGSGTAEAVKAWMDQGIRGYVTGMWVIGKHDLYLAPGTRQYDYMTANDCYVDPDTGMAFIQGDLESVERIVDYVKPESAKTMSQYWDEWAAQTGPRMKEILTTLAHDCVKWRNPVGLRSDYGKQMNEDSIRWLTDHGYKPTVFYNYENNELALIVKFKPVFTLSKPTVAADGKRQVTISVSLQDEIRRPAGQYGEKVRFETSAGSLSGPNPAPVSNGVATITLQAGSAPGSATVTVSGQWLRTGSTRVNF